MKSLDYIVFLIYFLTVASYGIYIYRKKREGEVSSKDYFLAEGSLTWWAIGASPKPSTAGAASAQTKRWGAAWAGE